MAESFEECHSSWEQTRGMMFRKSVVPLVFFFKKQRIVRLHSWFCPDNIDLVFLDENWEVVELQSELPPWSNYTSRRPFMFLLELPAGIIWKTKTEIGDVIHIVNQKAV